MDCQTVSVAEAAKALGIGRASLYRAVQEGRMPALRVGRKPKLRIPRTAIKRLLNDPAQWEKESAG
jgi:excisionase family DNA binding protein